MLSVPLSKKPFDIVTHLAGNSVTRTLLLNLIYTLLYSNKLSSYFFGYLFIFDNKFFFFFSFSIFIGWEPLHDLYTFRPTSFRCCKGNSLLSASPGKLSMFLKHASLAFEHLLHWSHLLVCKIVPTSVILVKFEMLLDEVLLFQFKTS